MAHSISQFIFMKENIFSYKLKKSVTVRSSEKQPTRQSKYWLRPSATRIIETLVCKGTRRSSKEHLKTNSMQYSAEDFHLNQEAKDIVYHENTTICRDEISIIYITMLKLETGDQKDERDKLEFNYCAPIIKFDGASAFSSFLDVSVENHT